MKVSTRVIALLVIAVIFFVAIPGVARAEEGNKFVNFLRKVLTYPFRLTQESSKVATETTARGVETVVKTGEATADVVTGKVKRLKDVVVEPVKGSAETAVSAIEGSVKIPIEAAAERIETK